MNKGNGAQATVIDDEGAADAGDEGAQGGAGGDDVENPAGTQADGSESEQGGEPGADGGAEGGEAGEAGGGEEGAPGTEGEGPAGQPADLNEQIAEGVRTALEAMGIDPTAQFKPQTPEPEAPVWKEPSEEQWVQHETQWGVPRTAIKATIQRMAMVKADVMESVQAMFAPMLKDQALGVLARTKGFEDVPRLRGHIDEFLKPFDTKHHSNPELLKRAAIYARGMAARSQVRRAVQGQERNRQIGGVRRPASPNGNGAARPVARPLSPAEKQAAAMLPGGVKEYLQLRSPKGQPAGLRRVE